MADYANFFAGVVHVGTPKQELQLLFDTQLSYNWIGNEDCEDDQCVNTVLFHKNSSTYYDIGAETGFGIRFLNGEVFGDYAEDSIAFDDLSVSLPSLGFISVNEAKEVDYIPTDGAFAMDLSTPMGGGSR